MNIDAIPIISVSYNSAELIEDLLSSLRTFYQNPVTIIDGSGEEHYRAVESVCARYPGVRFIHFDYNIHHGPGMAWAFQNLDLSGPVLVLDSDIFVLKAGFLEAMADQLQPGMYGVGYVNHINEGGFDVNYEAGAIRYLHPACMLVNIEVLRAWPMPTKHGAPMTEPMLALHRAGLDLVRGLDWLKEDFLNTKPGERHFLRHDWQGTVKLSGGYNLDEWSRLAKEASELRLVVQSLLPTGIPALLEIGDNDALLARACMEATPAGTYTAVGSHPDKSSMNDSTCHRLIGRDIDTLDDTFFQDHAGTDCWILDQALERCTDPEQLLARLRKNIGADASVIAVIPNAQHWSLQLRLLVGDLEYADAGLLSPCQRRWFSRATIFALFQRTGFQIVQGTPVIRHRLHNASLEAALRHMASSVGADADLAFDDAQVDVYVVKAVPV